MKKAATKSAKKPSAASPLPRDKNAARGNVKAVTGYEDLKDGRRIFYRKTFYNDNVFTTYCPSPEAIANAEDEGDTSCRLVKRKTSKGITWSFHGPRESLLRGDLARTMLQGKWDDPEAMAVIGAVDQVRINPLTADVDKNILRDIVVDAIITGDQTRMKILNAAVKARGLVHDSDLPRPWIISRAVVSAAQKHQRPPTAREVFKVLTTKKVNGRTEDSGDDERNFYRSLKAAGWGWLLAPS